MTILLLPAIALVALSVWWLVRGVSRSVDDDEERARLAQYAVQRDRVINELDRVETDKQSGDIDALAADKEIARLEGELATILEQLESTGEVQLEGAAASRHVSLLTTAFLTLLLPLIAGIAYFSVQGEELLWLAGFNKRDDGDTASKQSRPVVTPPKTAEQSEGQYPPQVMEMVTRLETRLQANPADGEGWKRLGRSYMVLGRKLDAVTAYSKASELLPDDKDVQSALQQLAASAGKHPQVKLGDKEAATHPKMPEGSLERIMALEKRAEDDPGNAAVLADLALGYEKIGQSKYAEGTWLKAHELEPENAAILAAYAGKVLANSQRDMQGQALQLYQKLYELDPRHPDGLWFLGHEAYSRGDLLQTREKWTALLAILTPGTEGHTKVSESLDRVEQLIKIQK